MVHRTNFWKKDVWQDGEHVLNSTTDRTRLTCVNHVNMMMIGVVRKFWFSECWSPELRWYRVSMFLFSFPQRLLFYREEGVPPVSGCSPDSIRKEVGEPVLRNWWHIPSSLFYLLPLQLILSRLSSFSSPLGRKW